VTAGGGDGATGFSSWGCGCEQDTNSIAANIIESHINSRARDRPAESLSKV